VRTRLTLWHAAVLTLIVCAFSTAILLFVRARLFADLDAQLGREILAIDRVYREEPGELRDLAGDWGLTLFQVSERGQLLIATEAWQREGLARAPHADGSPLSWIAPGGGRYRVQDQSTPTYSIVAALDESPTRRTLGVLAIILAVGVPLAAALAIAGGYFLAGRVLQPIGAIAEKARRLTAESLGERLPVANPRDEFGRLATVINDALSRVQDSFDRLRRFTADASHELRTPLTVMRSVGEVAVQKSLEPDACRDVVGRMLEQVDRLTRLVDSLLMLTRTDSGRVRLTRETMDLGSLAAEAVDELRVLADEKRQTMVFHAAVPVYAVGDAVLLRRALMNLLHNAIKYTPAGGTIRVETAVAEPGAAAIDVRDSGPGIAAVHQQQIFERFYRVDPGRSRESGGVGLGLAIARWAVEANGGRIELESEEGKGSSFRVLLPAAPKTS
jgi:heavy metal sensor kinase